MKVSIAIAAFLLLALTAQADSSTDVFTFNPGDWPVNFSLPASFAPVVPFIDGAGNRFYSFNAATTGPLVLIPSFELYATGAERMSVELMWTGPLPAPFDVVFDDEGEFWNFSQSIFNVSGGDLVSFNTGSFDGVLTIADPPAAEVEMSTRSYLLIGFGALIFFALFRERKRYRRSAETEYDPW